MEFKEYSIYKHFKGKYYATMGISNPIDFDDIGTYCFEHNLKPLKLIDFSSTYTETGESIEIFKIGDSWYHLRDSCDTQLAIYKALYDNTGAYARDLDMFLSEVDKEKYPEVQQRYRFQLISK